MSDQVETYDNPKSLIAIHEKGIATARRKLQSLGTDAASQERVIAMRSLAIQNIKANRPMLWGWSDE